MKFKSRTLRRATLCVALGLSLASTAYAQSNITGSIFGQANAEPGTTVVIENTDTGLTRTISVDSSGRYRASSLPNGNYKVTLMKDGSQVAVRDDVLVTIAGGTEVSFAGRSAEGVQELGRIEVTAASMPPIDVSQVDTRSVFTAEQLQKISIGRDIASVALLAPSVVRNDSYKDDSGQTIPSFGGAASSENAYFINGYAVTNSLSSLGFTTLPFDAIGQEQILTGGYGAEFGQSTGGVINIVTKRGTNEWKGGIYTIWQPEVLRASPRNNYYPDTGFYGPDNPDPTKRTDGTLLSYRNKNQSWTETTGLYAAGPIIKDRLFIYANAELTRQEGAGVAVTSAATPGTPGGWSEYKYDYPRWAAKVDWNINDNNILEFTGISDVQKYDSNGYTFDYSDFSHGDEQNAGTTTKDDSKLYIAKYTGYLTDDLTLSVLYGQEKTTHDYARFNYDPSCPSISASQAARAPGFNYLGCSGVNGLIDNLPGAYEKTKGGRIDVSYQLGDHDIRVGYERQDADAYSGEAYAGGFIWVYSRTDSPNAAINPSLGIVGSPAQAGGLGTDGYFVRQQYYTHAADVSKESEAQYIEDRWQVNDNFLLSLGLRNEQFSNYNGQGQAYINQRHQLAPRLGAVWDVRGDSSLKLFANAGRYHLALPNKVAIRGASAGLYTLQYFTYTGVDPVTGAPTGLNPIAIDPENQYVCPGTGVSSSNLECGTDRDPRTVSARGLKSHFQDEYILGMEHSFAPSMSWGAKLTYRDLKSAIDDTCTQALGGQCFIFNPGEGNTFSQQQEDGSFVDVHYSAEELNLPKLKRKYYALDLFLEHQMSDSWYGKVEYTFSKNWGNTEGQLASDLDTGSGGQEDVSATQDWDLPQLMEGANGLLPNHRAHQLKAFGFYQINDEWRAGTSLIVASGRPQSCTSYYPTAEGREYDGPYYHWCGMAGTGSDTVDNVDEDGNSTYVPPSDDYQFSPRGTYAKTPWTFTLNLNVAYQPSYFNKKLTFQADVLNVLNRQIAGSYNYNSTPSRDPYTRNNAFGRELNYSSPRTVRLMARYDF